MPFKDPAAKAAYNRRYAEMHRERLNAYTAEWRRKKYAEDPEYRERALAASRAKPLVIHAAQQRVYKALRRGEIVRPDKCEKCGGGGKIEAAHRNYTERLAIDWLCLPCHRTQDGKDPRGRQ